MSIHACVVGAGLTGLSAAVNIQKLILNAKVTLIADNFGNDSITPVTSGLFLPKKTSNVKEMNQRILLEWFMDGWDHHFNLAKSLDKDNGHSLITGFYLWNKGESPITDRAVFNYHTLSQEELAEQNFPYNNGCRFTTVFVDLKLYMRWLMKEFREKEGMVVYDTVFSLREMYGKYDIVINCTGKRAREQIADPGVVSVKGHVVTVRNVQTHNFMITDDDISIVPHNNNDFVDVGYVWQPGIYQPGINRDCVKEIMSKARETFPFLHDCGVVNSWAECRPFRKTPLVKVEMLNCDGALLPLVHNVALGTETLSLAWGTGEYVAHLVQDLSRKIRPFARILMPFKTLI